MPDEPIAAGDNTAVATTRVAPEMDDTAAQGDDAPESEEETAAQLGDFA